MAKPLSEFFRYSPGKGLMRRCKKCHGKLAKESRLRRLGRDGVNAAQREYNSRRPADQKLNSVLRTRYGITLEDYRAMEEAQDGRCKICLRPLEDLREDRRSGAAVDHCHTTSKVRGLLCHDCNRGLGCFRDDVEVMRRAISYLHI